MSYQLNEKIRDLVPYTPLSGHYRIRLDANESFFQPDEKLRDKIAEAVSSVPLNRYPDPLASSLCASFAEYYGVRPESVAAGNGSDELISVLMGSFLKKGEGVVTLAPDFSMYSFYAGINEANRVEFPKNEDFTVNTDRLIDAVNRSGSRMLIFSNPCNPTSLGLPREEIRRLVRSVDALVVLDEAYMDFWDQSLINEIEEYDNLVILRTCSKAAGMAGIRLGFAVANPTLIRALKAVKSPYNVNSVTQSIGSVLLREKEWLRGCTRKIVESKESLYGLFRRMEARSPERIHVVDGVTNFVTVRMRDSREAYRFLLRRGIAVRCFSGFLRITAGTAEENAAVTDGFSAYLNGGKGAEAQ